MATNPTIVEITEQITNVSVTERDVIEVTLSPENTTIEINNFAVPVNFLDAGNVIFAPHGTISATNVQDALNQLADQDFRTTTAPVGANVEEGDTWYDTDDNQLKVYRETSEGVFEWVPIIVGNISPDSDTLDAGAF